MHEFLQANNIPREKKNNKPKQQYSKEFSAKMNEVNSNSNKNNTQVRQFESSYDRKSSLPSKQDASCHMPTHAKSQEQNLKQIGFSKTQANNQINELGLFDDDDDDDMVRWSLFTFISSGGFELTHS
jgi:hypothetical protein